MTEMKITEKDAELIQTVATALAGLGAWEAEEELYDIGVDSDSGCFRTAFILPNVVVKVSQNKTRTKQLVEEAKFIQKMRKDKKYGRHFPHTEVFKVGDVTMQIQEKVDMSHRGISYDIHDGVWELAEKLGIDDCHEGNYGWRKGKNGPVPVFVDVDFRYKKTKTRAKKKRSWMV